MITVDLNDLMFELKEGAMKHVGPSNRSATAKLYDVTEVEARTFGDERVKCVFADDEGNEVEVALFPDEAEALAAQLDDVDTDALRD
jgi:hypothetical protein